MERHEGDPLQADTFDGSFLSFHLFHLAQFLGPCIIEEEFSFARFAPHNRDLWEIDFVYLVDRVGRKMLLHHGELIGNAGSHKQFLLKGHFLCACPLLVQHYPKATFLTVICDPSAWIRSGVNFLRVNPPDPMLGPVPWSWLALSWNERRLITVILNRPGLLLQQSDAVL